MAASRALRRDAWKAPCWRQATFTRQVMFRTHGVDTLTVPALIRYRCTPSKMTNDVSGITCCKNMVRNPAFILVARNEPAVKPTDSVAENDTLDAQIDMYTNHWMIF
jgi:hypothetical protein